MTFQLIHVDPAFLLLDKPAGLLAVPGRGPDKQDCLSARVQAAYPDARVVHRLDMATSGLLLMARGAAAQRALSLAFAGRRVEKRYIAVVAGRLAPPETPDGWGFIDLPLILDWPNRPRSKVDHALGKPSQTRWRVLGEAATPEGGPATRLELNPLTGRSHQLRVHLQALGHPILGDDLYGPPEPLAGRLCLHASELIFAHPVSGDTLRFACPPLF